jgi:aminoglycoside phosphotransferase (APT) family kinase protein
MGSPHFDAEELAGVGAALGREVLSARTLAGGYSHETRLLELTDGPVVARFGGSDPAIEAAVMAAASEHVPVPEVLAVLPGQDGQRPAMVIEYVMGTPLSEVLAEDKFSAAEFAELGAEVGRVAAAVARVRFDRAGFFADVELTVRGEQPWSRQLPEFAANCMAATPAGRLDRETQRTWVGLCAAHAPALARIDEHTRLAHADLNPKNILVTGRHRDWQVSALIDWEFAFSCCPYGDAGNMMRFAGKYPAGYIDGFAAAFAEHQPADLPPPEDWAYLGRVLDMFALSDLVTRPAGHPVADQVAGVIRRWVADGVPRSAGPG